MASRSVNIKAQLAALGRTSVVPLSVTARRPSGDRQLVPAAAEMGRAEHSCRAILRPQLHGRASLTAAFSLSQDCLRVPLGSVALSDRRGAPASFALAGVRSVGLATRAVRCCGCRVRVHRCVAPGFSIFCRCVPARARPRCLIFRASLNH